MENRETIPSHAPKGFFPALGLFCLALSLYVFSQSPFFALERAEVHGSRTLTAEELLSLAGLRYGENLFELDLRQGAGRLLEHPRIAAARLGRRLPDRVLIRLTERPAVGLLGTNAGLFAIAADGRVLGRAVSADGDHPVITGARPVENLVAGASVADVAVLAAADLAGHCESELPGRLSEINVRDPNDIVGYTRDGVLVRFGPARAAAAKARALRLVLEAAGQQKGIVVAVDVSVPDTPTLKLVH